MFWVRARAGTDAQSPDAVKSALTASIRAQQSECCVEVGDGWHGTPVRDTTCASHDPVVELAGADAETGSHVVPARRPSLPVQRQRSLRALRGLRANSVRVRRANDSEAEKVLRRAASSGAMIAQQATGVPGSPIARPHVAQPTIRLAAPLVLTEPLSDDQESGFGETKESPAPAPGREGTNSEACNSLPVSPARRRAMYSVSDADGSASVCSNRSGGSPRRVCPADTLTSAQERDQAFGGGADMNGFAVEPGATQARAVGIDSAEASKRCGPDADHVPRTAAVAVVTSCEC